MDLKILSNQIAYITINPSGSFLKSAQLGFEEVGLYPKHLIPKVDINTFGINFYKCLFVSLEKMNAR